MGIQYTPGMSTRPSSPRVAKADTAFAGSQPAVTRKPPASINPITPNYQGTPSARTPTVESRYARAQTEAPKSDSQIGRVRAHYGKADVAGSTDDHTPRNKKHSSSSKVKDNAAPRHQHTPMTASKRSASVPASSANGTNSNEHHSTFSDSSSGTDSELAPASEKAQLSRDFLRGFLGLNRPR
jgi:hypothetical protein